MALYLIGDLQGCRGAFNALLQALDFSPSRDHAYILGDLVNRGPDNLGLLRQLRANESCYSCLLGNHDLHMLAVYLGYKPLKPSDTMADVLTAPDVAELMHWVRTQPLARHEHGVLMVHAGVLPQWSAHQTISLANEVESLLQGERWAWLIQNMYGNEADQWQDDLQALARWRVTINALTRLRFCTPEGRMVFDAKTALDDAPPGCLPWFELGHRQTAHTPVAFGHWSATGGLRRPNLVNLDTGCVWGGHLSAVRLNPGKPSDWCEPKSWTQLSCPNPA